MGSCFGVADAIGVVDEMLLEVVASKDGCNDFEDFEGDLNVVFVDEDDEDDDGIDSDVGGGKEKADEKKVNCLWWLAMSLALIRHCRADLVWCDVL